MRSRVSYVSPFSRWEEQASVRSSPRYILRWSEGTLVFPPEHASVAEHPLVRSRAGEEGTRAALIHALSQYLYFTDRLEIEVVNAAAEHVALADLGDLEIPRQMRLDARLLLCDEAWHSFFSRDMLEQLQRLTGVIPILPAKLQFQAKLGKVLTSVPSRLRVLTEICFAVVSETLISGKLSEIPRDERVAPAIRKLVGDHARDETKHHAFFAQLFEILWPQVAQQDRRELGVLLPSFVVMFLEPDQGALRQTFLGLGLGEMETQRAVAEICDPRILAGGMRHAARATLRLFERLGVLDTSEVADAFHEHGLAA